MSEEKGWQLGEITPANVKQLRILNVSTLPVRYSDKFYNDIINTYSGEYLKFAFWNGFVVGAICARIEDHPDNAELKKLYIMTINVLRPYRRLGIASDLLKHITEKARNDPTISEIYLHVQVSNIEAKEFYLKHEFVEQAIITDYYKNIDPPDCFLLVKNLY